MPDREMVIKAIETHISTDDSVGCDDCTYENDGWCITRVFADALALLKEQEAVKPIKMQRMDSNFSFFVPYFLCGNCRYELEGKDVMFCAHCGRPVRWE